LSKYSHLWLASSIGLLAAMILAALVLPRSFGLTAFSDIVQSLLLVSSAAAFVPLALRSRGRVRLFWWLITLGGAFWLSYQIFWTYSEVVLRRDVPDLCTWDVVLFLHIVPLMAALALRPHVPRDEYAARIGQLDFALLLVWWFYLYVLIVMPWQYVVPDIPAYNRNLNDVYLAEKLALLAGLVACWATSKGQWRKLYAALFGMNLCYSASSTLANWAIARNAYYSGSFYDIPLVVAMTWLTWIGLRTKIEKPDSVAAGPSTIYGVWVARFSMIAAFSLPLFAAWSVSDTLVPPRIRVFRLALTLVAALLMGIMVFLRQRRLDRELIRLLQHSRDSFDNLERLQAQILQSEKRASISQLVGGAAHELNNPITAMLGYSDLLLNTSLSAEQKPLAKKIGQYVRRTKSLVASLISFARQSPAPKAPLDLNTLARTAVKLAQPQWEALNIEVHTQFDASLPKVLGDSNQLLQVCLQLVANSLHVLSERGGRVLTLSSERSANNCVLQITTEPSGAAGEHDSPVNSEDGLALSACRGILQEHRGSISSEFREDGRVLIRVELPATDFVPAKVKEATVPVLWQSRPYA
jgi:signal transduction histidine kinase